MDWKDDLENFLGGHFHQDVESQEGALDEFIREHRGYLSTITSSIDSFFESSMTTEEKTKFIVDNVWIYFPAIEKEPLEWLEEVNNIFKSNI